MNMYNEFAFVYDEFMDDFDYKAWFGYIEEIYEKNNVKPKNVLEMACGTGNLSYYLAKKGYNLSCFDLSTEMLTIADNKLNQFNNVNLYRQNMIDFNMNRKYDSIVAVCDSINYILKDEDLKSTFENVYNHMEEDGLFIFDINSYYKLNEIIGNNTFIEDREDMFYSWENFYDQETDICKFYLNFFISLEDGFYERFIEEHFERAYKEEKILEMLEEVGFKDIKMYKGFTFENIDNKTERINFVVKK